MQRAQDKIAQMQARAGAVDELLASGTLTDLSGSSDPIQAQLDKTASAGEVELQLAQLKSELNPPAAAPSGELGGGARPAASDEPVDGEVVPAAAAAGHGLRCPGSVRTTRSAWTTGADHDRAHPRSGAVRARRESDASQWRSSTSSLWRPSKPETSRGSGMFSSGCATSCGRKGCRFRLIVSCRPT